MTSVKKVVNSPTYDMIMKKLLSPVLLIVIATGVTLIFGEELKQTKMYATLVERSLSQARLIDQQKKDFSEHNSWSLLQFGETDKEIDVVKDRVTRVEAKIDHYH